MFADYLGATRDDRLEHHVLALSKPIHPFFRKAVHGRAASVLSDNRAGAIKLPRWPRLVRRAHLGRVARRVTPHMVLIYHRFGKLRLTELAPCSPVPAVNIYYERGKAWGRHDEPAVAAFLERMDGIIAVSRAARRVLELRYGMPPDSVKVHYNGLRIAPPPAGTIPRSLPASGPIRLSLAGNLGGRKAPVLAVHALAALDGSDREFRLDVAGGGPERAQVEEVAARLGVADRVTLHGPVKDMAAFYRDVHILLLTSVQEALGNFCLEAGFYGCPVVAPRIDGVPEVVEDGVTGYCVPPELPVEAYEDLGGGRPTRIAFAYDPEADRLAEPRLARPEALAEAVRRVCQSDAEFRKMSAAAHELTSTRFDFDAYVSGLDELLVGLAARR